MFYADDGRIAGLDHEWVHDVLMVTVSMFYNIGLGANLEKTKAMVCTPGLIWWNWAGVEYNRLAMGDGATFR